MNSSVCDLLLFQSILQFLTCKEIIKMQLTAKYSHDLVHGKNHSGYWQTVCVAYAKQYGLYHHCTKMDAQMAKFHLFNDLVALRNKWILREEDKNSGAENFKVRTMCRFRPGNSCTGKVLLPLHQFLKLRREKQKQVVETETADLKEKSAPVFDRQTPPEDFIDPILGIVMKEPVRLVGASERVVDRSVAIQCVLRGGDPFTGDKLTTSMIVPLPELAEQIVEWKKKNENYDPSVDMSDLKTFIDQGNEVNPLLLEALMDVQQIAATSNKIYAKGRFNQQAHLVNEEDPFSQAVQEIVPEEAVEEEAVNPETVDNVGVAMDGREEESSEATLDKPSFIERENLKRKDTAKIVDVNSANSFVSMHIPGQGIKAFHYTKVFHEKGVSIVKDPIATKVEAGIEQNSLQLNHNDQSYVYNNSTKESILSVMNGYNACVLCYGQTGSGKTFSLFGNPGEIDKLHEKVVANNYIPPPPFDHRAVAVATADNSINQAIAASLASMKFDDSTGVVLRSMVELLEAKFQLNEQGIKVSLSAQFIEIYNESVTDLLTGKTISVRRDTGEPVGAAVANVDTVKDAISLLHSGQQRKRFAATAMNDHSSRSHSALIITVNQGKDAGDSLHCSSSLFLVDLAGSERIKKSKAQGKQLGEAVGINSSLLVLGKVISSLVEGKGHIPYLESKLTTLLKNAFGGNCKTSVMIHCRPDETNADETLQSMRFGERCNMILNSTKIAATSKESTVQAIDDALDRMRKQLASLKQSGREHLDAYKKLSLSFGSLEQKKREIELI